MALAAPTTKDPADRETTNQHGDKYNDWHNKASQQREALFFLRATPHNTHRSPNSRNPWQPPESRPKAPETLDISKGAIALNHEFESLKTAGNAERKAMSCLSLSRKLAPSPSPRPCASFAGSAPLGRSAPFKNKKSDFFATFFRLAIPSHASNSGNRPFGGRFSALSRPYPRLKNPQQLPIAKKLQSMPLFCF